METRFLGRTGVRISALGFGTMPFGTSADEATSEALFRRCREAGINHFDCANVYGDGRAEELLGRFIASERDEVVIATKAYFPTGARGPNDRGLSRFHLRRAVEDSLRRLNTDRIDLFYLHRFDDETALEETIRGVDDLVSAGKILYLGLSNFAAWQAMKAIGVAALHGRVAPVALQPMYNLAKRQAEVEILPMAASEDLAVLPYNPLGGGLLTGRYSVSERPAEGRLVANAMYRTRYGDEANFRIAEAFTALARELGHEPATLAIAWVMARPGVTAPLIGARRPEHLEMALKATEIAMTDELEARISALSPTPPPATDRNEETSEHNYGSR